MTTNIASHESNKAAILERAEAAGWPCVVLRGGSIHSRELWERAVLGALPLELEDLARQLPHAEAATQRAADFDVKEAAREAAREAPHANDEMDEALNARVDAAGEAYAAREPHRHMAKEIGEAVVDALRKAGAR